MISPSFAGFNFHSGSSKLVLPDSFVPMRAVISAASIQPLSRTDRKFVTRNAVSCIWAVGMIFRTRGVAFKLNLQA